MNRPPEHQPRHAATRRDDRLRAGHRLASWASAPRAQAMKSVKPGDHGRTVKSLQRALGLTADGIYGEGTERVVQALPAPPSPRRRRHRRPVDLADAAPHRSCRPPTASHTRAARLVRARAAAQARDRRRRRLRPRHLARRARIPALARPDRRRRRRPGDIVGARHQRHPARPQAPAPSPRRPPPGRPAAADRSARSPPATRSPASPTATAAGTAASTTAATTARAASPTCSTRRARSTARWTPAS